jgi:hypothetical protein
MDALRHTHKENPGSPQHEAEDKMKRDFCGDCGVREGEIHHFGCDMERCPFCGCQLISCECDYDKLEEWLKLLHDKGRIPFIVYPNMCARCGELWPDMFMVPDAEWERYVEPAMRRTTLCAPCFVQIKTWIDGRPPSKEYLQQLRISIEWLDRQP